MSYLISQAQESDINAKHAFDWTSFSPEVRENQYTKGYVEYMQSVVEGFEKFANEQNASEINAAIEAFRDGYAKRLNDSLRAHSRIASQAITGAGGWTHAMVRRNDRANESYDNKRNELLAYAEKSIKRMKASFDPTVKNNAPIMSGDSDALERLQAQLDAAKSDQERMKAHNAAVRKGTATGVTFESWRLTNNNANIRRIEERIKQIAAMKEAESSEISVGDIRIVDNTEESRYQIFFPGKPSKETIAALKSHGYRWTPSKTCWQAYRNQNGRRLIEDIKVGKLS